MLRVFTAFWCPPCKVLKTVLKEVDIEVEYIDVDENPDLAIDNNVGAIPLIQLIKDGQVVKEHLGVMNKSELEKWINE